MSVVHLIRHGRTAANERRLYCGATDEPLSARGLSELESMTGYPAPEGLMFLTSGMRRANETLRTLYGDVSHGEMPALMEMNFGAFEMRSYEEMKQDAEYLRWIADEAGAFVCPGGESANAFRARVFAAFDALVMADRDFLVVTHGGVISNLMARAFPAENRNFYEWQPGYGRGYAIRLANGTPVSFARIPRTEEAD
jgi:alpha-ribazole phosphatase